MVVYPHPELVAQLFAHRYTVFALFQKLVKPHGIDHISVSHIDTKGCLSVLSSTPSIEYSLFQSGLWQYDKTYQAQYVEHMTTISWDRLHALSRGNELHYIKQLRTNFELGVNFAVKNKDKSYIISLASHNSHTLTRQRFASPLQHYHDMVTDYLQKILPLFIKYADV